MVELIQGDCLEEMKKIPDGSIDLVLTDPPYGIKISSNPFRQKYAKKEWDNFTPTKEYFDEIFRISKHQVIWGGNYFELPPCRGFFVWDKGAPGRCIAVRLTGVRDPVRDVTDHSPSV